MARTRSGAGGGARRATFGAGLRGIFAVQDKKGTMSDFLRFSRGKQIGEALELVKKLPLRQGNIDEDALGVSLDELVQREARRFSTPIELIDAFVNRGENVR